MIEFCSQFKAQAINSLLIGNVQNSLLVTLIGNNSKIFSKKISPNLYQLTRKTTNWSLSQWMISLSLISMELTKQRKDGSTLVTRLDGNSIQMNQDASLVIIFFLKNLTALSNVLMINAALKDHVNQAERTLEVIGIMEECFLMNLHQKDNFKNLQVKM